MSSALAIKVPIPIVGASGAITVVVGLHVTKSGVVARLSNTAQNELVNIRGQAVYDHVAALLDRGLIEKTKEGRSFKITTTSAF